MDSNILEGTELERGIRNTHAHSNIVLKPQQEFSAAQLRGLKEFFEDFFNVPPSANDAKALGLETLEHFKEKYNELGILAAQRHEYL